MASNNGQYARHRDERHSDLAVLDANEYKQKRRLERILDAMDNIVETANYAKAEFVAGRITKNGRNMRLQGSVRDAIWESWNLLEDHEETRQRHALEAENEEDDEDSQFYPHSPYFTGHEDWGPIGLIPQQDNEDIVVWGLEDFFELPELWTETWTTAGKTRGGLINGTEQSMDHSVPRRVTWRAAIRLKRFLNDVHDLEVTFEALNDKSLPTITGFDQSGEEPQAELINAEFNHAPDL